MVIVEAYQHVFSTVSKEVSPNNKRGYQTLFASKGLSEELIREIESRCIFQGKNDEDRKWQYYPLGNKWVVLSQSVPLQELDEFGRRGRYLTHNLLVSFDFLEGLGYCGLDILNQFAYLTNLDQVFEEAKYGGGTLQKLELSVRYEWPKNAFNLMQKWHHEELEKLGRFTWQFERIKDLNEKVTVSTEHQPFIELSSLLFSLSSPRDRLKLSFDSMADGCNWGKQQYFWLQCFQTSSSGVNSHKINLQNNTVNSSLSSTHDSPFGIWMKKVGLKTDYINRFQNQGVIEIFQNILYSGKKPEGRVEKIINSPYKTQFIDQNKKAIVEHWMKLLPFQPEDKLKITLEQHILSNIEHYFNKLIVGYTKSDVSEWLYYALHQLGEIPTKKDRKELLDIISGGSHSGLFAIKALWDKNGKEWLKYLEMLNENEYQFVLQSVNSWPELPLSIIEALGTKHVRIWMKFAAKKVKPRDWSLVLNHLNQYGDYLLSSISEIYPQLDGQSQQEIIKWAKKEKSQNLFLKKLITENEKQKNSIFDVFRKGK